MVNSKAIIKQLLHLLVSRSAYFMPKVTVTWMVLTAEVCQDVFLSGRVLNGQSRLDRFLPSMDEHHDLVSLSDQLRNFLKGDEIQVHL